MVVEASFEVNRPEAFVLATGIDLACEPEPLPRQ